LNDLRDFASTQDSINLGNLCAQLLAVPLGQAARHDQAAARAVLFVLRQLENRVDRFLFRGIDERAGVHDEHVGASGVARQLVTRFARKPQHHLGVDEVFRAAERD